MITIIITMINKLKIKEIMSDWNYWNREIPSSRVGFRREKYLNKIMGAIDQKEIIALQGIRRSGKSTLMFQIMEQLAKKGKSKNQFLYINFEDFRLINDLDVNLLESFYNIYREEKNPENFAYVFFDEIQNVPKWEKWIRTYYEKGEKVKFIISGSSSTLMSSELATLVTGRNLTYTIYPFSFAEYLLVSKIDYEKASNIEEIYLLNNEKKALIKKQLNEYLLLGGFPEVKNIKDAEKKEDLLRAYLEDIIRKDVGERHQIREIKNVFDISGFVFSNIGQSFSERKIAETLEQSPKTVSDLIEYLKEANLFLASRFFSYSARKIINRRNPNKIYSQDNGFVKIASKSWSENFGNLYENLVAQHIFRRGKELFYWKEIDNRGKEKSEVDFVYKNGDVVIPINVTADDAIRERERQGILDFFKMQKHGGKIGIVICDDLFSEEVLGKITIKYYPLWAYLLAE